MTEGDSEANERSDLFKGLAGLAALFFLIAIAGVGILASILSDPGSGIGSGLVNLVTNTQGSESGLGSVIDLLIKGISAAGSLSLSLALAAIYLSQNRILNTQVDIQETQAEIMSRQKLPSITAHPDGVFLHTGKPTLNKVNEDGSLEISTSGSGTYLCVSVENHGEEAAEQVQMACLVDVSGTDIQTIYPGVTELTIDGMVTKPPQGEGAYLSPTKEVTLLHGTPAFSSGPSSSCSKRMFLGGIENQLSIDDEEMLDDEDHTEPITVRYGFVLIFTNSVREEFHIPLENAYSITSDRYSGEEDITLDTLRDKSVVYDIDELIEDISWTVPSEAFADR